VGRGYANTQKQKYTGPPPGLETAVWSGCTSRLVYRGSKRNKVKSPKSKKKGDNGKENWGFAVIKRGVSGVAQSQGGGRV